MVLVITRVISPAHIQYASSANTKKEGIEVSLCVNPRRSDCRIAFVDSDLNQDKTKKIVYKIHKASFKQNMSDTPEQVNQVSEESEETTQLKTLPSPLQATDVT